jgi:hypothetical protein
LFASQANEVALVGTLLVQENNFVVREQGSGPETIALDISIEIFSRSGDSKFLHGQEVAVFMVTVFLFTIFWSHFNPFLAGKNLIIF